MEGYARTTTVDGMEVVDDGKQVLMHDEWEVILPEGRTCEITRAGWMGGGGGGEEEGERVW